MNLLKRFMQEEDGLTTVEIVVILAVLVSIALIFRKSIINFVKGILGDTLEDTASETTVDTEAAYTHPGG